MIDQYFAEAKRQYIWIILYIWHSGIGRERRMLVTCSFTVYIQYYTCINIDHWSI